MQATPGELFVKPLTIALLYYNNGDKILRHLTEWEKFNDRCSFVVIDDGSQVDPARPHLQGHRHLDLRLFRIREDIAWNIPGARNLAATVATTPWILIGDMDTVVTAETFEGILPLCLAGPGTLHMFNRKCTHMEDKLHLAGRISPGSMLYHRADFWRQGGYHEDMRGVYGLNDGLYRDEFRMRKGQIARHADVHYEYYWDGTTRTLERGDFKGNMMKYLGKLKNPRRWWKTLEFSWTQEEI
jgi:hypothetical protein